MYKWDAEKYNKNSANQQRIAQELIAKLDLRGNEKILDIGCGDGKITAEIATYVPNGSVLGIDNSQEMIDFAQSKFPSSHFSNLNFKVTDANELSFNNEFDVVVSFFCLHWIIDHTQVLKAIETSLKPYGKALLTFMAKSVELNSSMNPTLKIISSEKWNKYFQDFTFDYGLYTPDEYRKWLEATNLKEKYLESVPMDLVFQGKNEFREFCLTVTQPFTNKVPPHLVQDLIDDMTNAQFENNPPNSEGLFCLPQRRLEIYAMKVEV
ncbi:class I SAM-dependent methyltransferase [Scytonema sp. NUACC21]